MITQFGNVEVIDSIEADFDDILYGVLLKNEHKGYDDGAIENYFSKVLQKER